MIFLAVIIGLVLIALIRLCIQLNNERESYSFGIFCGWAMTSLFILEMICICESVSKPRPTPMDVYRGKTTLEYTIRDGVKIDSVVVFKNSVYGK
jgi:hypothetical protein